MTTKTKTDGRNDILDAYRAILIGAVLCFHYLVRWAPPAHAPNVYHYTHTYPQLWGLGAFGVHVFFVISGLVITMTVLRSRDALDFTFRRLSRLYPAAIVCATLTFVVTTLWGPEEFHRGIRSLVTSYTLFPNLLGSSAIDGAYWSLAIELQFYLLVAISFLVLRERFWMALVGLAVVECAAGLLGFRSLLSDGHFLAAYFSLFLIGMASWYAIFEKQFVPAGWLAVSALITFPEALDVLHFHAEIPHLGVITVLLATASLIIALATGFKPPLGPLPYLGRISYSLYLLHQNIGVTFIAFVKQATNCPDLVAFAAGALLSTGLAAVIFRFVEMPAQSWLRGHYLRRRPQLATAKPFYDKAG